MRRFIFNTSQRKKAITLANMLSIPITCKGTTDILVPLSHAEQFAARLREFRLKYKSRNGAMASA